MFLLVRHALSRLQVPSIQQTMARQSHQERTPDFHEKYGNVILAGGAMFCIAVGPGKYAKVGMKSIPDRGDDCGGQSGGDIADR